MYFICTQAGTVTGAITNMLAVGDTKKKSIRFIHYESNVIRLERLVEMKEFEVATVYCTTVVRLNMEHTVKFK
jgi:hypothetical protein